MLLSKIDWTFKLFFAEKRKKQFEKLIFLTAIIAFILHFSLLLLANWKIFSNTFFLVVDDANPLSAIYTPFSIILLYEIYLLIYYLPKSITIYLGKQYEIIALIMIRKIFEDISNLSSDMNNPDMLAIRDLLITFGGFLLLFLLIFCFYKLSGNKNNRERCKERNQLAFVASKKVMALGLLLLFVVLFVESLIGLRELTLSVDSFVYALKTINNSFFDVFFTALILTEVLLLLFTFNLTEKFHKVIRNSGFIISTILMKLSFMVEGVANVLIVLLAVSFGIAILWIQRLFEKKL